MVSSRLKTIGLNKCLIDLIIERIIQQLKEQRGKAKKTCFIKRNCKIDAPCPDTDADLDVIAELNEAISVLENSMAEKELVSNCG